MAKTTDGYMYEAFISRAHRFQQGTSYETLKRAGAEHPPLVPCVYYEEGSKNLKPKEYDAYIIKMQTQITRALDKFLKMKFTPEEIQIIELLKDKTLKIYDTDSAMEIVYEGLELTQKYKEY